MLIKLKFLERSGKRILNKFAFFIPCFFTFLNCILGFCSILKSFDGDCKGAALYIIFAALADSIDGRLARALKSTSYLGTELDSLCDAISFCLAPSVLIYAWYKCHYFVSFSNLAFLAIYLCAGIYRLAKFNIEESQQDNYFRGLPTTLAAVIIALSCFYYNSNESSLAFYKYINSSLFFLSYLMLSPFKFYSFKKSKFLNFNSRNICSLLVTIFLLMALIVYGQQLLLILLIGYIFSNLIYHIISIISDKLR